MSDQSKVTVEEVRDNFESTEIGIDLISFTVVDKYTTFRAEYAVKDSALIFHFYKSCEVVRRPDCASYWMQDFPTALSRVAQEYFNATYPRLKAAFTEEVDSWWFTVASVDVLDLHGYAARFLAKMDAALDPYNTV